MKNHKAMTGVAYMFLGAVLLVSGPAVQEQIDEMASNPTLQLAKAMYQSMAQEAAAKPQVEVLAASVPTAARQFDSVAIAPAVPEVLEVPKTVAVAEETIEVVAPKVEVELAQLPAEHQARIAKMTSKLKPAKFAFAFERAQMSRFAALKAIEMDRFVIVQEIEKKKEDCDKVKQEIERSTERSTEI